MSGVANSSRAWQDQLRNVRKVLDGNDADVISGYVPTRHRRKSRIPREPDPFEGVVFKKEKYREAVAVQGVNKSEDHSESEVIQVADKKADIERVSQEARSDEIGEEAFMSRNRQDPFSSGNEEDDTRNSHYPLKGRGTGRRKADYDDDHEIEELTQEEQDELDRKHRNGERVKKGILWTIAGMGTASLLGISAVIVTSLLGNSKSRMF